MSVFESLADDDGSSVDGKAPPPAKVLDWVHGNASTDANSIHHRLGTQENDASPGNHRHRGTDSYALFDDGDILTDISNTATGAQIASAVNAINALLRELGAGS
jgi:hypothetical protein